MKVVMIDTLLSPPGEKGIIGQHGMSDIIWNLSGALKILGVDSCIIGPYDETDDLPDDEITVHRYRIPQSRKGWNKKGWLIKHYVISPLLASKILKNMKDIDLVHVQDATSPIFLRLLLKNFPIVYTPANCVYHSIESEDNPWGLVGTNMFKMFNLLSARFSRQIIATSQCMAECWIKCGADPQKIHHIPLGIDTNFFKPISNARATLKISSDEKIILFVGRQGPEKGIAYLLEAIQILKKSLKRFQVLIIGEGHKKEQYIEYSRTLKIDDVVNFHGWVPKEYLPLYYSAADVVVVPSLIEPFGRVVIEAMACKAPVIGTNIGGIPDHIKDKQTGLLVPPKNPKVLSARIMKMLQDKEMSCRIASNAYE